MRLSWNEIRARAAKFSDQWKNAVYEKEDTQSFYNAFFEIFGIQRRSVARYEQHVKKLDNRSGFIDLFWPGVLIVEQKSTGRDLNQAYEQAGEYFDALAEHLRPRYILVSDFQSFHLYDLDQRQELVCSLSELHAHVEAFGFIIGVERREFRDQDPANIKASELVGQLHDLLDESGYRGHDLERFLVRIVFCLFADDTGIFEPRDIFLQFIEGRTREDGPDLGPFLSHIFQVINTPVNQRYNTLDEELDQFPYVNGELFNGTLSIPSFNQEMRQALIDACLFDWSIISPAIFGALFQSVMDPQERREQGAHYTTEKNILKLIAPLFLDDLYTEFNRLKSRKDTRRLAELKKFQHKLGQMIFFDPACGCGNFLIITYRELRKLELLVLKEIHAKHLANAQAEIDSSDLSLIDVNQFYGIEINEFPVRIAETALWMMDHIMNTQLSLEFGQTYTRIPLETSPSIIHGDALELDWSEILSPQKCSFVLGNPPFVGAKYQSKLQRAQVHRIASLRTNGGTLDYVTAWFMKAGQYIGNTSCSIGFVSTNSVTRGEQVAQLWPILFERYELEIAFAHRTFTWGSDARGKAHVYVVILGLDRKENAPKQKRLFSYPDLQGEPLESQHSALSPYLFDAGRMNNPNITVREESDPINGLKKMVIGSKPIDGGHYIFDEKEREDFLALEPKADPFIRPYVGAREFLHGEKRWILALHDVPPNVLAKLPHIRKRMASVRVFREQSKSVPTQNIANTPMLYHIKTIPEDPFLVIPETSSGLRDYIPVGYLEPPVIPSNSLKVLSDATLIDFALLTSAMHMAWMRTVAGRLGTSYRYSIGVVYNTFPMPPKNADLTPLERLAQTILDTRSHYPDATLANLYDPGLMPPDLRNAHLKLDREVDQLYRSKGFNSERERFEHLIMLYEKMQTPQLQS
ncbi:MAG: N-6 DNA methylase [Bacteroidetes bacterium]|nr:N-6 DNA methylase [Bacteroidota bacterium]